MCIKDKIVSKADDTFVDDWRSAWKWASTHITMVFGFATAYYVQYPDQVADLLKDVPGPVASVIVMALALGVQFQRMKK